MRLARLHFALASEPTLTSGKLHVLLELPDHLGSSSIVVDHDTSELVERSTYMASGGPDSDYRPGRWNSFREDYRFTGKEEDIEVGLQYFGKRFYAPGLGRWISADPLTIHSFGADANAYAYANGRPFSVIDPTGLLGIDWDSFKPSNMKDMLVGVGQGIKATAVGLGHAVANPGETAAAIKETAVKAYEAGGGGAGGVLEVGKTLVVHPVVEGYKAMKAAEARGDYQAAGRECFKTALATAAVIRGGLGVTKAGAALVRQTGRLVTKAAVKSAATEAVAEERVLVGCFAGGTLVATTADSVPISDVALGSRLLPDDARCHYDDQQLTTRLDLLAQGSDGSPIDMSLLRSASWASALGGNVGDRVYVELPEIAIQGWAILQRIMTVAPPRDGPGCTVIATFRRSSEVVQVHLSGYQALVVTRRHPLFSQSRGDWVAADALEPGEVLRTRTGTVQVEFVDRADADSLPVYNLEVSGVHRYFVGEAGVEAHNANACGAGGGAGSAETAEEGIVYRRTNPQTGEKYVGQAKSDTRFDARQIEHDRKLGVKHDFEELGRAKPGTDLDVLEETHIRAEGGLQKEGGTLANKRHQMSQERYEAAGGKTPDPTK